MHINIKNLTASALVISVLAMPILVKGDTQCVVYTIKKGDTLGKIAKKYSLSIEELGAANHISNYDQIFVGDTLIIPTNGEVSDLLQSQSSKSYVVSKGDTLAKIAKRFGTTVDYLVSINHISNPDRISVGQVLSVEGVVNQNRPSQNTGSSNVRVGEYRIQKGDTLAKITKSLWGENYGTRLQEYLGMSDKEVRNLQVGDVITIPSLSELLSYTPNTNNRPSKPQHGKPSNGSYQGGVYYVQKGDTLAKISQRLWGKNYGSLLQDYLGLSDNEAKNLQIGDALNIPSLSTLLAYHSTGDTSMGGQDRYPQEEYFPSVNDYVSGGVAYHVVQKGENLTKIVCYYYRAEDVQANGLVERVAEYNGLESKHDIKENDTILIPLTYEDSRLRSGGKQKVKSLYD